MTIYRDKCLLDLPVLPEHRDEATETSIVQDAYLAELSCIKTPDDLAPFIRRWKNVWLLHRPGDERKIREEVKSLLGLDFDVEKVFGYLQKKGEASIGAAIETDVNARIMAQLALPEGLMDAFLLANHYDVGSDLGLVRLFLDPYPEHCEKLRGW